MKPAAEEIQPDIDHYEGYRTGHFNFGRAPWAISAAQRNVVACQSTYGSTTGNADTEGIGVREK